MELIDYNQSNGIEYQLIDIYLFDLIRKVIEGRRKTKRIKPNLSETYSGPGTVVTVDGIAHRIIFRAQL
jgi:hypothetical protein